MSIYRISNPFGYNNHITIYADNPMIQDLIDKSGLKDIQIYDINSQIGICGYDQQQEASITYILPSRRVKSAA